MSDLTRQPELVQLDADDARGFARAQRFTVERVAGPAGTRARFHTATEAILLLPAAAARIVGTGGTTVPGHAIAIVAGGDHVLELAEAGEAYILSTDRLDRDDPVNAATYAQPDARVAPVGEPYGSARALDPIRVYPIAELPIPPDNGRLRFLQSATMSINWVEYQGTRGRNALSPHAHGNFEQASLAIAGSFVHHLRTPWGRDADQWRDDAHLGAAPRSLIVIPPEIIHTTEGVGEGLHILVDIFAPPRTDFIARNWVHNAADYVAPVAAAAA